MNMFYRLIIKRVSDVLIAFTVLIVMSPVMILISILLIIDHRESPFFVQNRIGKSNRQFKLIKFRTMRDLKNEHGILLSDSLRISVIGKILRKISLDEIPQLINVLSGTMSLIGPRPLLPDYLPLYNKKQIRRHEVRPGITGWAQINGRNSISWEKRFELDVWYVDNLSFILDIKIILITLLKVLKREGINSSNDKTMIRFTGTS